MGMCVCVCVQEREKDREGDAASTRHAATVAGCALGSIVPCFSTAGAYSFPLKHHGRTSKEKNRNIRRSQLCLARIISIWEHCCGQRRNHTSALCCCPGLQLTALGSTLWQRGGHGAAWWSSTCAGGFKTTSVPLHLEVIAALLLHVGT